MKRDILIIGDSHSKPGVSTDRFFWAGRYCAEKRPEVVVELGDWADMPSLSSYDIGKKSYEGRRYLQDVQAANSAREEFNRGLASVHKRVAGRNEVDYSPKKYALGGNHCEGRISKVIEGDPKLDGLISVEDFKHEEYGWEYVPFQHPIDIQGFTFCHYFTSGVMGRPIGGEMPALSLIRKQFTSCVAGHTHLWDLAHRTKPDGTRVWGLVAGCYLAEDQWEDYAGPANKLWWKGLTLLKGCENGDFEALETITIKQLKELYGTDSKSKRKN